MNLLFQDLASELKKRNIRPSHQRIQILDYLHKNQCHPTADQIYKDLQNEIPTLSKATIYNTLSLFVEAGLVRVLSIENKETRYDIITETHGHFKCDHCGVIVNFELDPSSIAAEELTGFRISVKNVYFRGACPGCLININHIN